MSPLSRRTALLGIAASANIGRMTLALAAAPTDKRLVVVILRGALDGMAAVVPYGDPGLTSLRGQIVPPAPGQPDGLLDLGGFFGPYVVGYLTDRTGSYGGGVAYLGAMAVVGALLVLSVRLRPQRSS